MPASPTSAPRYDNRDPARDIPGKPGSSTPYGSDAYPKVVTTCDARKGTPSPAFLSQHPDLLAPGDAPLLLVQKQRNAGDNTDGTESRVYEKVPGAPIQSIGYDERGDVETTITQTILNNGEFNPIGDAEGAMQYLFNSAEAIGIDMIRATATTKTVLSRTPLYTEEAFTTNRTLMRHITGTLRTTISEIVPVGTDPTTGFHVVESNVTDKNKWQAAKTTASVDAFITLVSNGYSPSAHGALTTTTETIVQTGTAPVTLGLNVLSSTTEDLDGTHALQHVVSLATGESWPTIRHKRIDPHTQGEIIEERTVVAAGTVTPSALINHSVLTIENFVGSKGLYITMDDGTTGGVVNNLTIHPGGDATATALAVASAINGITNMPIKAVASDATVTILGTYQPFVGPAYIGWSTSSSSYFHWSETVTSGTIPFLSTVGQYAQLTGVALVATEEDQIDKVKSYKVVTTRFSSPHQDEASAVVSVRAMAYEFPALLDLHLLGVLPARDLVTRRGAKLIPANEYTFWVISDTKPTLTYDQIIAGGFFDGVDNIQNVLHDDYPYQLTNVFAGQNAPSTPTFSEYTGRTYYPGKVTSSIDATTGVMKIKGTVSFTGYYTAGVSAYGFGFTVSTITTDSLTNDTLTLTPAVSGTPPISAPFTQTAVPISVYTTNTGTAWIGNEKAIHFSAEPVPGHFNKLWECRITKVKFI